MVQLLEVAFSAVADLVAVLAGVVWAGDAGLVATVTPVAAAVVVAGDGRQLASD